MSNRKQTKRALLTSITALVMCVVMLAGTTFAWFTDTATANVNTIKAGTLDVALEMSTDGGTNWTDAEGQTLKWVKATADKGTSLADSNDILWEPGCTYQLQDVRVVNNGNLALKYKILITGINGDAKLNKAIKWTISDSGDTEGLVAGTTDEYKLLAANASHTLTISGTMDKSAGNDYQGLTIDGVAITVVAAQYTYEYDSENNQYDSKSTYLNQDTEGAYLIGSAGDLRYFAAVVNADRSAYANKTIKLTSDINLGGAEWTPIMMAGSYGQVITFDGQGHTISNFTVTANEGERYSGLFGTANYSTIKSLNVNNATVKGYGHVGAIVGHGMVTTIEGCTVTNSKLTAKVWWNPKKDDGTAGYDDGDKVGAVIGWTDEGINTIKNCTVEKCTVEGYRDIGGLVGYVGTTGGAGQIVTGNTVKNTTITQNLENGYETTTPTTVQKIVGRCGTNFTLDKTSNTATDVTIKK